MRKRWRRYGILGILAATGGLILQGGFGTSFFGPLDVPGELSPLPAAVPAADDWPWWRGTASNGIAPDATPPVHWSGTDQVRWNVAVPGRGHASPCVWGKRIFIATADEERPGQSVVCYNRDDGAIQWQTEVHRGPMIAKHEKNSHASATPACDGTHVYATFAVAGALWASALDLEGRIVWQTELGPFDALYGYGSSPALYESLVIAAGDQRGSSRLDRWRGASYLVALDRGTGKTVWRARRDSGDSYGTPVVGRVAGKPQLLLPGKKRIAAYDPATGRELWTCAWRADRAASTTTFAGDLVFASVQQPESEIICIRADGSGDVTNTHVVWRGSKGTSDLPSPLCIEKRLYVMNDAGILTCFETETGKRLWQKRLRGTFTASLVAGGGNIYAANEEGMTYVVKPGPQFELVAENLLGDGVLATPALCGRQIFLRTGRALCCIENQPSRQARAGSENAVRQETGYR